MPADDVRQQFVGAPTEREIRRAIPKENPGSGVGRAKSRLFDCGVIQFTLGPPIESQYLHLDADVKLILKPASPPTLDNHVIDGVLGMLTSDIMRAMWPHVDPDAPGLMDGIIAAIPSVLPKYGLSSDLLVAHAMAQFSEECGAGSELVENLRYSAQGLMKTWPNRFDAAKAAAFAGNEQQIANEVYNGRMGNRVGSNDGFTYRGRGGSQVTGREAYEKLGQRLELDLIGNPDLVNDPQHFLECATADFVMCGCLPFAANDDVNGVTFHLNGGFIGLSDRMAWLGRWKTSLNVNGGAQHGTLWVQQSLNKLGAEPPLDTDGTFGPLTAAAVKAFQQAHGLNADGKVGPLTIGAIEQELGKG
jgi:putative chitinase